MRRLNAQDGAVIPLVAVLLVVLFACGAIAVDAGALYQEHRELQNGADAAALAVAQDCAGGATIAACGGSSGDPDVRGEYYADGNAEDDTSEAEVDLSEWSSQKVRVNTTTIDGTNAPGQLTLYFARALGIATGETTATARVKWGPVAFGSIGTLPLTFSACEYNKFVPASSPGGTATEPWTIDNNGPWQVIYFHGGNDPDTGKTSTTKDCAAQAGQDRDGDGRLPGGFGWLETDSSCGAIIVGNEGDEDPGSSPSHPDCPPELLKSEILNKVIFMPVFDDVNGLGGANGKYHFSSYAAFYVTGYNFGGSYKEPNPAPCGGKLRCISGWFTTAIAPGGVIGTGPSTGVNTVAFD